MMKMGSSSSERGDPAGRRPWEDPYMPVRRPVDVPIREESIRLGQFLKLADLAEVGSDAKELISAGEVPVNGEPETRRGRQLRVGDVVELDGRAARVARRPGSAAVLGALCGLVPACRLEHEAAPAEDK